MKVTIKTDVGDYSLYGVKTLNQCGFNKVYIKLLKNSRSSELDLEKVTKVLNILDIESEIKNNVLYINTNDKLVKFICETGLRRDNSDERLKDFIERYKSLPELKEIQDKFVKR